MRIHIVQKGDTLFEIAKQYGVDFQELVKLNSQLSSPDMIMPGMKIKIPGTSKQVKEKEDKVIRATPDKGVRKIEGEKKEKISPALEKRVEKDVKRTEKDEKPKEKPIQDEVTAEKDKPKKIELKPIRESYPVKPIIEQPKMPKKIAYSELPKDDIDTMDEEDTGYPFSECNDAYGKPIREPLPLHHSKTIGMQPYQYQPMYPSGYDHCCCHCCCRRRPVIQGCGCRRRPSRPTSYQHTMPYYYHPNYPIY